MAANPEPTPAAPSSSASRSRGAQSHADTHERILDGAVRAVLRHGLGRLAMRDVGRYAGVARGTVYRHFANREALLEEMAQREGERFMRQWKETLAAAPPEERLQVAFAWPARFAREYPLLQKLVESDPDFVLRSVRESYPAVRQTLAQLLGPVMAESALARRGLVSVDQLVDWASRVLISAFLIPEEEPESIARGLAAVHRTLTDDIRP